MYLYFLKQITLLLLFSLQITSVVVNDLRYCIVSFYVRISYCYCFCSTIHSTDEDARQAMLSDGGCIKDVQIRLLLSSRNEMQKVIETARQQSIQYSQVYMQQMQQPQIPIGGTLPPLTAKVYTYIYMNKLI